MHFPVRVYDSVMNESKAMILGCGGLTLSDDERAFFKSERPWGFILFARNVAEHEQLAELVNDLRDCVGGGDVPILIDQEGGRVQRIRPPLCRNYPPASVIGSLFDKEPEQGLRAAWLMARLLASDLSRYGINIDCIPVLDVPGPGGHSVIGERAYSSNPETVVDLGRQVIAGLMDGGVLPVIKHIPGHGRGDVDSHFNLPVVRETLDVLSATDFVPFKAMASVPMAMTAHVVFTAVDPDQPATTSQRVIEDIIRRQIGFDGLLMTDDTSMKALSGDFATKAGAIFDAGCDVMLHCNGVMEEMVTVAANTPVLKDKSLERAQKVVAMLGGGKPVDEEALRLEFEDLVAEHDQSRAV